MLGLWRLGIIELSFEHVAGIVGITNLFWGVALNPGLEDGGVFKPVLFANTSESLLGALVLQAVERRRVFSFNLLPTRMKRVT